MNLRGKELSRSIKNKTKNFIHLSKYQSTVRIKQKLYFHNLHFDDTHAAYQYLDQILPL